MKIIPLIILIIPLIILYARGKRYTDNLIHIADAFSTNYYTVTLCANLKEIHPVINK